MTGKIILDFFLKLLPTIVVGIFMAWFNSHQKVREMKTDHQADIRRRECLLQLQMQKATADLSRATAIAMKRGSTNGEVDEGLAAYDAAKISYFSFLNEQAVDHIAGTKT